MVGCESLEFSTCMAMNVSSDICMFVVRISASSSSSSSSNIGSLFSFSFSVSGFWVLLL